MKKAIFIFTVIVLGIIINNLLHSIYDLWHKQDLLTSAKKDLEQEKLKNSKLKAELSYVESQQFLDETARNKLFLAKPGEQQVLISKDLIKTASQASKNENLPNWQKWLQIFF
ncbi:MAG TPA: septum formation initiator family protein [Candidatus Sulfotelmatobacter sp.]|nr:septum formation initiator family protein [Candidatus Sulfotelmatobacter sp.]